jgi:uncharacterized protein YhaN
VTDKPRTVPRECACELTDEEKLQLGAEIAAKSVEIQEIEELQSQLGTKKRPMVKDLKALHKKLHKGTEDRTLLCEVIEGPGQNISFRRPDTGEVFGTRAMTAEERQLKLDGREDWLSGTQDAVERARGMASGGDNDEDDEGEGESDDDDVTGSVVPFGGRAPASKKAARKPRKGSKKGKR